MNASLNSNHFCRQHILSIEEVGILRGSRIFVNQMFGSRFHNSFIIPTRSGENELEPEFMCVYLA